mmetsp:Transcript_45901/g.75571  ORF Transcript_45901/g.75571 Transcript_45901/m.75571 type:complete len:144 (-) Transcript_45901:270-701(-)
MGHNSAVKAFLDRHGFSDVNRPRVLDESGTHRIKMEPVYPIEVASALGKEAMVNMLLDAGATSPVRESQSSGGSSCTTSNSKESKGSFLQSFASLCGTGSRKRFAASPPASPLPLRSCLAPKASEMASEACCLEKLPVSSLWV